MSMLLIGESKREKILAKTGCRCAYCGWKLSDEDYTADHIIPRSRGGNNAIENLLPSCRSCNSSKGMKTLEEFRLWRQWEDVCRDQRFSLAQMDWLLANTNIAEMHPRKPYVFFFEGAQS